MEEKIRALFAAGLGERPENIADDSRPANIERWDSMQHLILVAGFEEEFGVDIDPEDITRMYEDFKSFRQVMLEKIAGNQAT